MLRRAILFISLLSISRVFASSPEQVIQKGVDRLEENVQAQQQVDKIYEQSQALQQAYQAELKTLQGLNQYNQLLAKQLIHQEQQIATFKESISNATAIERQIMPLLSRMLNALDIFITADLPFLLEERQQRLNGLRALLERPEFSTSEKTRRVFEAFQIENEYGYTIESYKGKISVAQEQLAVDILRIGRIALMYQDITGKRVGFWNQESGQWQPLTERHYQRYIAKGLRVAKEEISPDLLTIPLLPNLEERP